MTAPESTPRGKSRRLRRWIGPAIVVAILLALVVVPEFRSRRDASALCLAMAPGERLETADEALAARVRELKPRYGTLFVAGFHADDEARPEDSGAVVFVHLGAFPFGRNLCVVRLDHGLVREAHTLTGADDYAWCRGEMRLVTDCEDAELPP